MAAAAFSCRQCAGEHLAFYFALGNDGRFRYYRCPDCGLVNYDLAGGLDQSQYTAEFVDPLDDTLPRNRDKDASFAFLRRHVPGPASLFDVGCGSGRLLHVAHRAGWRVKGLELSERMAAMARERLGVEVVAGSFPGEAPDPADLGAWDVVSLRHVLEHLPDGLAAMRRIRELLRPGGHVLVEVPNVEALAKKWRRFAVNAGLHRPRFPPDLVAGHCNEYCRRSFDDLLRRTGFELLRWETYSKKPFSDWLLNRIPIGTKARALARRT